MARFEAGDEVKLKIGSCESLVTITREIEDNGPGIYEFIVPSGRLMTAHESVLWSKQKSVLNIFSDKAIEFTIRAVYEAKTRQNGGQGTGPADLITRFVLR